ncbi:DHA2 family efflux MFS transporter permease subunit [Kineococcus sp. R8]|uniref:MDR family MFS transporter n=1 Tax=Kineococcus siccus TaxID=2696567 RepID=UPI0014136D4D|nr:MDR family MFS transporter [Kineococcus siccus]NAZ82648.1 DHA2 family efflux MFS transporter permease subunit [Kineococcus siccus]
MTTSSAPVGPEAGRPDAAPAVPAQASPASPLVASAPAPVVTSRARTLALTVLVLSAFVMILNETILSVALRVLSADLGIATTTVQWLTSGFLLTMAVVIPLSGFLLERFTPRQVFAAAMSLFTLGTLVAALAPGFGVLLAGRVLQAGGTAVMIPLLMTSVMRLVPVERRGATMGTITIVIAVAPAIGPTVGGAVLSALDWRWMFWLVLPLAVTALVLGSTFLRLTTVTRKVPVDVVSVLLSAVGFGGLLYGLSTVGEDDPAGGHAASWAAMAAGLAALVVFVRRQRRLQGRGAALLDLRPFTHRQFTVAVLVTALIFLCLLGASAILLPLYLQGVQGRSTFVSGLAVLPGGLALGLLGRPVGALYDRIGARRLVIPGAVAMAVALGLLATLRPTSPLAEVIGVHVLFMAGFGLMMTPLMTDSLSSLPEQLYSHGSAILTTLQQVAGALGTAVFVTIATRASLAQGVGPDAQGLQTAFTVAAGIGVVIVALTLLVRGPRAAQRESSATA